MKKKISTFAIVGLLIVGVTVFSGCTGDTEYTLTIEIDGEGTVEVDGEEIEDGWTGTYDDGTEIDLDAIPDDGWELEEWNGTDETGDSITITMDDDKDITADFEAPAASIDDVDIHPVEIDGELEDELYCDDIREDGHAYYKGSERPHPDDPDDTLPPEHNYSEELFVTVYDEDGNEMDGVDVELSGAGVESVGTTNDTGQAALSLDGLHLTPGEDNAKLEVEATADGLIGSETAEASIWVLRGES